MRKGNYEEISFGEVWRYIKKNILLILALTLLIGGAAFGISKFLITPKYEATTTMIVGTPKDYLNPGQKQIEYNDIMMNQKLLGTYSEIIKSRGIANYVIDRLDLDMDYKQFSEMVSVATVKDTEVMSVKVVDTIPERAMDIANETSEVFRDSIKEIMTIDNVQILDAAEMPEKPASPDVMKNTVIGILLGLVSGVLIAITKELTDTSMKTANQITETFDIPVLGVIPLVKKDTV